MTSRDPLSLQQFLFTCTKPLGGTWQPAACAIGDVSIKCTEATELGDGSIMRLTIIVTAVDIDSDKPRLHLTHLVDVRSDATQNPANPPSAQSTAAVPCAFASVDEVLAAIDDTTAKINDQMSALVAGLAVAHV